MMRFVQSLFDMASDLDNVSAVGFSFDGTALELRSPELLSQTLPKYFRHNKVSSFIRQLNNYGFRRIVPPRSSCITQSYCHPYFQRDRPDLLKGVRRPSTLEDAQQHMMHSNVGDDEAHFSSPEKKARSKDEVKRKLEDALMMIRVLGESNRQLQRQNAELQHRLNDHEVAALLFSVASSSAVAAASASSRTMDDYDSEYDADEECRFSSHSATERRNSLEEVRSLLESNARSLASSSTASPTNSNSASPTNLFCFE